MRDLCDFLGAEGLAAVEELNGANDSGGCIKIGTDNYLSNESLLEQRERRAR
mgnify:CR=1 FL=1